ncbi:MAG: VWA domain-containing protein [bacterium]
MSQADEDVRDAACLLAIDARGLQGAIVRGSADACEAWLAAIASLLPAGAPVRRIPSGITDDRLIGGLDVAATIAAGRPVCERGLLAAADGGVVVLFAGTTRPPMLARVLRALDAQEVLVERDGVVQRSTARFAVVCMASPDDDDRALSALADRVGFIVDLGATTRALWRDALSPTAVAAARARIADVRCSDIQLEALCLGAEALGIRSARLVLRARAAACANAALAGRAETSDEDLARAARLVLAPRATAEGVQDDAAAVSETAPDSTPSTDAPDRGRSSAQGASDTTDSSDVAEFTDIVVQAARGALPPGLVAAAAARTLRSDAGGGRAGAEQESSAHGRQIGARRGELHGGARLDIIATLRAAAPMQRLRRQQRTSAPRLIELRRDDFRMRRLVTPATTTTVFVVDASGSAALNRLAEAKGAIELMLAEGYARRDRVAMIAFRGKTAEVVVPRTHALARARRAIAGLAAGGGTPLASGLDLAAQVVLAARRDGADVATVVLTDGRANVARDGTGGRVRAEADALDAAQRFRALQGNVVFVDTAPRPDAFARQLATGLGARYVRLAVNTPSAMRELARSARDTSTLTSHG